MSCKKAKMRREPDWSLTNLELTELLRSMARTSQISSKEVLGLFFCERQRFVAVLDKALVVGTHESATSTFRRYCDMSDNCERLEYDDIVTIVLEDLACLATITSVLGERFIRFASLDDIVEFQRLLCGFGIVLRDMQSRVVWSKSMRCIIPPVVPPLRFGELYLMHPSRLAPEIAERGLCGESRFRGWLLALGLLPHTDDKNTLAFVNRDLLRDFNGYLKQFRRIKPEQRAFNRSLIESCEQITKDIPRLGKELASVSLDSVQNILIAYVVYDADVNYAQGMADLAGAILMVMREEHLAFACFKKFMQTHRRCFSNEGIGMRTELSELKSRIQQFSPALAEKFDVFGPPIMHSWLLMLFNRQLSHTNFCRILDICFATQSSSVAIDFAATIVRQTRAQLLELDFDGIYSFFVRYFAKFDFEFTLRLMRAKSEAFVSLQP
jgi:hypothetical protein